MVELEKIEQELKTLTTKPQCPWQEQKLGLSAQKKREQVAKDVLKSDESVILHRHPITFVFHISVKYPPAIHRKHEVLGQKQISTIALSKRRSKEKAWSETCSSS